MKFRPQRGQFQKTVGCLSDLRQAGGVHMSYRKTQTDKALTLMAQGEIFNNDQGNGKFLGRNYPFALQSGENNIYAPVLHVVKNYFSANRISWWGGKTITTHPLSSQAACLNHLFPLRGDKEAVLSLVSAVDPGIIDVLPIEIDKGEYGYIAFEATSSKDHLKEGVVSRGNNCTSLDALMLAKYKNGRSTIIAIEWKYTEYYSNTNKALCKGGDVRKSRYDNLITASPQLISPNHDIYYFEPFYQLMRQTLWLEQMLRYKNCERIKADDYLHLHVIPAENAALLDKVYVSGKKMEETWRGCLHNQDKYKIISPKELLSPLDRTKYDHLLKYLETRYWD